MKKRRVWFSILTMVFLFFTAGLVADGIPFGKLSASMKPANSESEARNDSTDSQHEETASNSFAEQQGAEEIENKVTITNSDNQTNSSGGSLLSVGQVAGNSVGGVQVDPMNNENTGVGDSLSESGDNVENSSDIDTEENDPEQAEEVTAELPSYEFPYVVAKVEDYVNIRAGAGTEFELVGRLNKKCYAQIVERGEEWTHIKSGSVDGYISNTYLYFDNAAIEQMYKEEALYAEVTAGTVNLRTGPGTDSEIIREVHSGKKFPLVPSLTTEEWVAVKDDENIAYLSAQFVEQKMSMGKAMTSAQVLAAIEAAAQEKALIESRKNTPASTLRAGIKLTDEELELLAIVVMMEAGGESYAGQLAVANVVINRLISGKWGHTIKSVVYAPGQFSGANSGRIEKFASKVTSSCRKAAKAAANGDNNIGDYMYFRMKNGANFASYKKYFILGCHVFYSR